MSKQKKGDSIKTGNGQPAVPQFVFRLFITGVLPNSANAVANSKAFCEEYLKGRYTLEVIDIYQEPDLALSEDIIAIPVLIKKLPLPEERVIGDLSDTALLVELFNLAG
jgi:circadian clock protein KaiB